MKALIILCGLFLSIQTQAELCIQNIKVVDVAKGVVTNERDVLVKASTIASITDVKTRKKSKTECRIIDGTGKFLMPGLIDSHVHVDLWHYGTMADEYQLPLAVLNGVTAARDAGGSPLTLKLRDEVNQGLRFGPDLMVSSLFLSSDPSVVTPGNNVVYVGSAADSAKQVNEFFAQGYSAIKLDINLETPAYEAAAEAAKKNGSYVYGHPLTGKRLDDTYFVRLDETLKHHLTLEHLDWTFGDALQRDGSPYLNSTSVGKVLWWAMSEADEKKIPAVVAKVKASGKIISPTMAVIEKELYFREMKAKFIADGKEGFAQGPITKYLPEYVYNDWKEIYEGWDSFYTPEFIQNIKISIVNMNKLLKAMDQAGIPIISGTDAPARPYLLMGPSIHDEMRMLLEAGLSMKSVLQSATLHGATAMGKPGKIGEVIVGAQADLLILDQNPLLALNHLKSFRSLVLRGKYYSPSDLDKEWEKLYQQSHSKHMKQLGTNLKVSSKRIKEVLER